MKIEIRSSEYQFAYGKKPRGYGNWWWRMNGKEFQTSGTISDVKKQARAEAMRMGLHHEQVVAVTIMT